MPLPTPDPSLSPYVTVDAQGARLHNPSRDYLVQGAAIVFLVPLAWVLVAVLVAMAEPRAWAWAAAACGVGTVLTVLLGVLGVGVGLLRARTPACTLSSEGAFTLRSGVTVSPGQVTGVKVGQPSALLKWKGIAVQTAGGETHWVLQRIPPSKRGALEGLARWVGQVTGAPVEVSNAADVLGLGTHSLAALCYFPVQGIWLMASVAVLFLSKNAEARFAAKMSLAYYGLSGVVLAVWMLATILPAILVGEATGHTEVAALVAIPIAVAPALARIGFGVAACVKAWRGQTWIIPGMGWLARRWLPRELA